MPQKKYDLTSDKGIFEKDFKTEVDRKKRLDEIVNADYQQRTLPKKYKLPTFACPACRAKNIMFAGDAVAKNETILTLLEENGVSRKNLLIIKDYWSRVLKMSLLCCQMSKGML